MSYKYYLLTFLGFLIILGLVSQHQKYREGLTDNADDGPLTPGKRPYEFDPKKVEADAKVWSDKQDKKWSDRRDNAKNKAASKNNLGEKKLDDQINTTDEENRAHQQKVFSFIAERHEKEKARINKSEPVSASIPPPPISSGLNSAPTKRNSCDFFNCGDDYQRKSGSVTEEQVRAAMDVATNAEAAVAMYKKNADLAVAASLVGPECTKIWATEASALYTAAIKKSATAKIAVETIKKKSLFPASCAGSECTKDECCEEIPGRENKHKSGCGCMKCGMERESGGSKAQGGKVDMSAGPFVRNFFEGTEIHITPEGEPRAMPSGRGGRGREKRNYSDYHKSYKDTVHHYPQESIRFDLLTPVPYSDAMAAPMGPGSRINPKLPKPALEQLSFRDRQINNID